MPKAKAKSRKSSHTGRPLPDRPAHRSQTEAAPPPISVPGAKLMFALGSSVKDIATELDGTLVLYEVTMDGSCSYAFRPNGLDADTGQPRKSLWIEPNRIRGGEMIPEPEMYRHLHGTIVTDQYTGFTGMAVSSVLFLSGCVHANIQPAGLSKSDGAKKAHDFDVRNLSGDAVVPLDKLAKKESQVKAPSPLGDYERRSERSVPQL